MKKETKKKMISIILYLLTMILTICISAWAISYIVHLQNEELQCCKVCP